MKCVQYVSVLAAAVLMAPFALRAVEVNQHSVLISEPVIVDGVHLNPGTYKIEWNQPGPNVQVTFERHGKAVATVPATVETNDRQVTQDDFVSRKTADGRILSEIDFSKHKEALMFPHHA
jgi:hypothetical protein